MALAMEQYGRVYREAYGVPVVNLRIFRCFGPDEDADRSDAGIVAKFVKAALDGKSPVIFGDGQQTRDLIYVDNVVAAILAALEIADPPAEPLNIASGEAVAVNFLWNLVLETCGKKRLAIDPTYLPAPPWDPKHTRPQIARACKVLGWAPAVRLREGLARTVEFYQAQRNADPNAWFAPKDEPAPKKKLTLPNVAVPTRRFGSVVTPAFGTPITNSSATRELPRASSGNSFANALLRPTGSAASPLPRRTSSVVTPPPIPPAARSVASARCRTPEEGRGARGQRRRSRRGGPRTTRPSSTTGSSSSGRRCPPCRGWAADGHRARSAPRRRPTRRRTRPSPSRSCASAAPSRRCATSGRASPPPCATHGWTKGPFVAPEWFSVYAASLCHSLADRAAAGDFRLLVAHRAGRLVAALPLVAERRRLAGVPARLLRSLSDDHSQRFDLLLDPAHADDGRARPGRAPRARARLGRPRAAGRSSTTTPRPTRSSTAARAADLPTGEWPSMRLAVSDCCRRAPPSSTSSSAASSAATCAAAPRSSRPTSARSRSSASTAAT